MTGLDLSGVQKVIDGWLIDHLGITRNTDAQDGPLDESTGQITPTPTETVWDGYGAIQDLSTSGGGRMDEDPNTVVVVRETGATHRALIRLDRPAPDAVVGDHLTVLEVNAPSASGDLLGSRYRIVHTGGESSFTVAHFLWLVEDPL